MPRTKNSIFFERGSFTIYHVRKGDRSESVLREFLYTTNARGGETESAEGSLFDVRDLPNPDGFDVHGGDRDAHQKVIERAIDEGILRRYFR